VTGTNVRFGILFTGKKPAQEYTGSEPWDNFVVTGSQLSIGGEEVVIGLGGTKNYQGVRYSSTHFASDASYAIHLKVWYEFRRSGETLAGTLDVYSDHEIYNHSLSWGTYVNGEGTANEFFEGQTRRFCELARFGLIDMHHTPESLGTDDPMGTKSGILDLLNPATVVISVGHGDSGGLFDSYQILPANHFTWAQIGDKVDLRTPIAKDNLVYLYSCDTLSVDTSTAPYAFRVSGDDRAYIGFTEPVSPFVCDLDTKLFTGTCTDHIATVLSKLQAGLIVSQALAETDQTLCPCVPVTDQKGRPVSPEIIGDGFTTLKSVYFGANERDLIGNPESKWYYVE
jgi:hypothetical protein